MVVEFLTVLFEAGLGYSSLNTARSALSTYVVCEGQPVGSHPLVKRFMKGVFQLRPALPRYDVTWDTSIVLSYLRTLSPVKKLSLKLLTFKLVMLLALLTGQRCQTLHALNIEDMTVTDNHVKLRIKTLLKQSKPGKHLPELCIKGYAPDRRICLIKVLREYLRRTVDLRSPSKQLLISYVQPHNPIGKSTVSRWIKTTLSMSGIDTSIFSAHSTRSASTSCAKMQNVPLATILRTAGWSSSNTFGTYYDKTKNLTGTFARNIQNKLNNS